ncbi:hypothetical protein ID866_12195 [Astraeus odoratus]|nr:hypothetical protein ID866_12195 [Astraeus odoratus]
MSMRKSSMVMGAPAKKSTNWTKVPDKELATDLDDTDSVGNAKAWEKCRRLCAAEEAEKCWKEEEERQQKEAEAEQKWKDEERKRGASAAAEARKQQRADSEAQASRSWVNASVCIRCARLGLLCLIPTGVKKHSACGSCTKAKERCEWPEIGLMAKKVADDDDDEIVILSSWKTKQQGGGETLEEISDQRWGELIQAVFTHMDVANGHLEKLVSVAQSNSHKMQWHYMLMEGLVGQQQMLLSRLVEITGAVESGGSKGVAKGAEELQEP